MKRRRLPWTTGCATTTPNDLQSLGDVAPMKRFELRRRDALAVIDAEVTKQHEVIAAKCLGRVVDEKGRVSVLRFRYHVGQAFVGETRSPAKEDSSTCATTAS